MSHSADRFIRSIERLSGEAYWLNAYQKAMEGMIEIDPIGIDYFWVSLNALKDARLVRLIRVLEDDGKVASIWYVLRSNEKLVRKAAKKTGFCFDFAKALAGKLPVIRTKTIMHLDKKGIMDIKKVYQDAGVTHDEISSFISQFWVLMQELHLRVIGSDIQCDEYDGRDIQYLADLRYRDMISNGNELDEPLQ